MGKLIDADLVIDNLSGWLESMKDYDAVKDVINNMQPAFDPDKAVQQIKELSIRERGEIKTEDVITIVRGAGMDEPIHKSIER